MLLRFLVLTIIFCGSVLPATDLDASLENVKVYRLRELLPKILEEQNIDVWLNFTREGATDPLLPHLGSNHMVARAALIFGVDRAGNYRTIAIAATYDVTPLKNSGIYDEVIAYEREGAKPHLQRIIAEFDPGSIAINQSRDIPMADGLTTGLRGYLEESLPDYASKFIPSENLVISLFSRKTPAEIAAVRRAATNTQLMLEEALSSNVITPGKTTEIDVANYLLKRAAELEMVETCLSIVAGPMRVHSEPTDRVIQHGDVLTADVCFSYAGYSSDIQRTAYVLKKREKSAPKFLQKYWQDCKDANMAALAVIRPGVSANESDKAGRSLVVSRGYREYPYGSGHAIGRQVHDIGPLPGPDWPERYGSQAFMKYEADMTMAIEPAVIVNDDRIGGEVKMGLEEDILVTEDGYEVLGSLQERLWLIK